MNRSRDFHHSLSDAQSAAQQSRIGNHAPRPLPLFLELIRIVSDREPGLAARALDGLARYEDAQRRTSRQPRAAVAQVGPATLRDCGGEGAPVVLVPSLINPPHVLDLDERVSLARAVSAMGRRSLLLDWGEASQRETLSLGGHVVELLLPLLREAGERPNLIGYCLGGTMALAAANLAPVERVATIAAPWRFSAYPDGARESLQTLWSNAEPAASRLGVLPMEVLQSAFWSLDPRRTVAKFADFAELPADSPRVDHFIVLEDWANEGEPLPYPAARELIEDLFGRDLPGIGEWRVGGHVISDRLSCPTLHVTSAGDRITPCAAAPADDKVQLDAGHVGMIVGSARTELHRALADFLA